MSRKYNFDWDALPAYSNCVSRTISSIHQQLSAQLRIEDLAKECYISRSYLARQFKKEIGMTIKQYILMQLINSAQWQLSHTDASVEKISHDLGFCNQFYFSECFKKHCSIETAQNTNRLSQHNNPRPTRGRGGIFVTEIRLPIRRQI